ncbi:MAG: glycine--tRNA ligase subunit beta, partial [Gallionella sp.]
LADKLETLVGMFGIGQIPTGDKDPFALRRHALGVIRMLSENNLPLSLKSLLKQAANIFGSQINKANETPSHFIYERLAGSLRDQGNSNQEVEAVLSYLPEYLCEIPKRLLAVKSFVKLPEAESLAAAYKRVNNILKKAIDSSAAFNTHLNTSLLLEPAEIELSKALISVKQEVDIAFEQGDYTSSLLSLAALKKPVDAFFDSVMVNVDNLDLRANRLTLLDTLHKSMNRVADLSRLAA